MSGGIMIKSDAMRKLSIVFFSALALSLCGATIAEAATAAPAVAKAAATAAAAKAVKTPAKTTTPPKQAVAAAKAPAKAVSYSLVSQKPKAEKKKPKKIVKIRKQVVDAKVAVWGRTAEAAEALAYEAARKLVGSKDDYLVKDSIFIYEAANRVICTLRINFTDEIPETWYLETEMVSVSRYQVSGISSVKFPKPGIWKQKWFLGSVKLMSVHINRRWTKLSEGRKSYRIQLIGRLQKVRR